MYKLIALTLSLAFAGNLALAQGSSQGPGLPQPGTASGTVFMPGGGSAPVPEAAFMAQCLGNLSALTGKKLQAQLLLDKAVTKHVLSSATLPESALGASCNNVCGQYAKTAHMISWARRSPGFLSEPEHTLQNVYTHMAEPALPGPAELDSCLPQAATKNWCPTSGTGVGAGPSRQENPMDKIRVCITVPDAFQHMNFSASDVARNCARPAINDAADRIQAEKICVSDAIKADAQAKAKAEDFEKFKANGMLPGKLILAPATGNMTVGPMPVSGQPASGGAINARKKP